jgi:hypothetical protein
MVEANLTVYIQTIPVGSRSHKNNGIQSMKKTEDDPQHLVTIPMWDMGYGIRYSYARYGGIGIDSCFFDHRRWSLPFSQSVLLLVTFYFTCGLEKVLRICDFATDWRYIGLFSY